MRKDDERILLDNQRVKEFEKTESTKVTEKTVSYEETTAGKLVHIDTKDGRHVTRREHTLPEYFREVN